MRIGLIKFKLPTLLAFLLFLVFMSFSCSQLDINSINQKNSISFKIKAPRSALSLADEEQAFIDIELQGSYTDSQTAELNDSEELTFTFDNVPIGKEVKVFAQIYTLYQNERALLFQGLSQTKEIKEDENLFELQLGFVYNSTVTAPSSLLILNPIFTIEHDNSELENNSLAFKLESGDESFAWKQEALENYQKARVTYKGLALDDGAENKLRFRLVKSKTGARYALETRPVTGNSQTYEFEIPQFIKLDEIAIENNWDSQNNSWAKDFTCRIERIELLKDASLLDPDFNQITKDDNSCTVQKPALQQIVYTNIDKNKIEFDSRQGIYESKGPYSAAYWEYEELDQYDKTTIYVKPLFSAESIETVAEGSAPGRLFTVKGYSPADLSAGKTSSSSDFTADNNFLLTPAASSEAAASTGSSGSQIFVVNIADLKNGLEGDLTALEFQNNSGNWDSPNDDNSWAPWSMEIEKIILSVIGEYSINVTVAGSSDIEVSESNITNDQNQVTGKRFTAPEGYTSYIWKVDGQVQTDVTGNVFDFDMSSLTIGQIYDITLLASNETFNHSWSAQVKKE